MKQLAVALFFLGVPAFAGNVSYYTTGVFSGPDFSGGNLVNGGATISYQGAGTAGSPVAVALPFTPMNLNFGQITVADPLDVIGNFAGDEFTLTIWQAAPTGGKGSASSSISGGVTGTSSNIALTLSPPLLLVGGTPYAIPQALILSAPNFNTSSPGVTLLEGSLLTPEPASLALLGAALTSLGIAFRRRIA